MILKTYHISQSIDAQSSLLARCLKRSMFILFLVSSFNLLLLLLLLLLLVLLFMISKLHYLPIRDFIAFNPAVFFSVFANMYLIKYLKTL